MSVLFGSGMVSIEPGMPDAPVDIRVLEGPSACFGNLAAEAAERLIAELQEAVAWAKKNGVA